MMMQHKEYRANDYLISTDRAKLNLVTIHRYLSEESYWAAGRTMETVSRSIDRSLCFGLYESSGVQVGFARVVTDYSTFAWLCDVFVLPSYRGKGLGKWLVQTVVEYPDLHDIKRMLLGTRDAHSLYRRYGFEDSKAGRWMELLHGSSSG
jgi:GNAT superfamily N-acetyltransferase